MKESRLSWACLSAAAGIAAGCGAAYVAFNHLYGSVIGLIGVAGPLGSLLVYGNGAAVGLCVWTLLHGLTYRRWRRVALICVGAYYAAVLVGIVLLKSPGIREVNLDLGDVATQAVASPAALWVNVLLFAPLGAVFAAHMRGFWRPVGMAAVVSLLFEAVQYAAALGIADVVDFVCNAGGAALGVAVWRLLQNRFTVAEEDGGRWLVLRRRDG